MILTAIFLMSFWQEPEFEIVQMNVSAYCPGVCCCGDDADGITASGVAAKGLLVAAPRIYTFGTVMVIPGYAGGSLVEVQDRGGAIKGNKLDVFFPTHIEARKWGRQLLDVIVFKKEK